MKPACELKFRKLFNSSLHCKKNRPKRCCTVAHYLEKLGYTKEKRSLGEKEIWSKPAQVKWDLFFLYFNAATGEVVLPKVINYCVYLFHVD